LRRCANAKEVEKSNGRLKATDVRWNVACSELTTAPKLGETITDADGIGWVVLQFDDKATLGDRYRLWARNLRLTYSLDVQVDVFRMTYAKGDGGAQVGKERLLHANKYARCQPTGRAPDTQHETISVRQQFDILFEETLDIRPGDRIKDLDNTVYKVTSVQGQESIGTPFVVATEVTAWPRP